MSFGSYITEIKAEIARLIKPNTLDDSDLLDLIYSVLQSDMPNYRSDDYDREDFDYSFREADADGFRVATNATLDNDFSVADLDESGGAAVLETIATSLAGLQPAFISLTSKSTLDPGSTLAFDLCLDADVDDAGAGTFLYASEGSPAMSWDTSIAVDAYPSDSLSLRLTLTGAGKVHSVRMTLLLIGDRSMLGRDLQAIVKFSAAQFFSAQENLFSQRGQDVPASLAAQKSRRLQLEAAGLLTTEKAGPFIPGRGSIVNAGSAASPHGLPVNPAWERFKRRMR